MKTLFVIAWLVFAVILTAACWNRPVVAKPRHVVHTHGVDGYVEIQLFDGVLHGFNKDYFRHQGPMPDKVDIAVVGDSYAVGWGVGEAATLAARLDAVNFGRAGLQPRDIWREAETWLLWRKPKIVVYLVNFGDVYPHMNNSDPPSAPDDVLGPRFSPSCRI